MNETEATPREPSGDTIIDSLNDLQVNTLRSALKPGHTPRGHGRTCGKVWVRSMCAGWAQETFSEATPFQLNYVIWMGINWAEK